jgi:hypothetical protein
VTNAAIHYIVVVIPQQTAGVVGAFYRGRIRVSWANADIRLALIGILTDTTESGAAVLFDKTARWVRAGRLLRWFRQRISNRLAGLLLPKQRFHLLLGFKVEPGNHRVNIGVGLDVCPVEVQFLPPDQARFDALFDDVIKEALKGF